MHGSMIHVSMIFDPWPWCIYLWWGYTERDGGEEGEEEGLLHQFYKVRMLGLSGELAYSAYFAYSAWSTLIFFDKKVIEYKGGNLSKFRIIWKFWLIESPSKGGWYEYLKRTNGLSEQWHNYISFKECYLKGLFIDYVIMTPLPLVNTRHFLPLPNCSFTCLTPFLY